MDPTLRKYVSCLLKIIDWVGGFVLIMLASCIVALLTYYELAKLGG